MHVQRRTLNVALNATAGACSPLSHGGRERAAFFRLLVMSGSPLFRRLFLRSMTSLLFHDKKVLQLSLYQVMMGMLARVRCLLLKTIPPLMLMHHLACILQVLMMNMLALSRYRNFERINTLV